MNVKIERRMIQIGTTVIVALALPFLLSARKFYDDDPLAREPRPLHVDKVAPRKLSDIYDLFSHLLHTPGERQSPTKPIPAQDVNTLGEVLDGAWYEARHGRKRMTVSELVAGPGDAHPPSQQGNWTVISAKSEGITPGFLIQDSKGDRYFLKFDPIRNPEMATAADVISSKFFHALGYHVPENHIVYLDRAKLQVRSGAKFRDSKGRQRSLTEKDITEILLRTPRDANGRSRATASRLIPGEILHSHRYFGTRADDPNDVVPHEHRRSLRGLHVFCAWLAHDDSRAINTLDVLAAEGDRKYVRHYLIDFGSTLGSASTHMNSPRSGFEQFFTWKSSAKEFFTLGLWIPPWSHISYPNLASVGRFSAEEFKPSAWTPEYPNPAFSNRLPGDVFWAARQVARFTDEDIQAIVETGKYSDPAAAKYVTDTLIRRRDAIVREYLSQPLALEEIRVSSDRVMFDDIAVTRGFVKDPPYRYQWSIFDNESERKTPIPQATTTAIPANEARYLALDVSTGNEKRRVTIYLRRAQSGFQVAGIDRVWN